MCQQHIQQLGWMILWVLIKFRIWTFTGVAFSSASWGHKWKHHEIGFSWIAGLTATENTVNHKNASFPCKSIFMRIQKMLQTVLCLLNWTSEAPMFSLGFQLCPLYSGCFSQLNKGMFPCKKKKKVKFRWTSVKWNIKMQREKRVSWKNAKKKQERL